MWISLEDYWWIRISDTSSLQSCNFLTNRDLSFIFEYVVGIDMNFIHKKLVVLKFKESVQISRQSRFLNYGCDFFWTFDTLHALSVRMCI